MVYTINISDIQTQTRAENCFGFEVIISLLLHKSPYINHFFLLLSGFETVLLRYVLTKRNFIV